MNIPVLQTSRLTLREWRASDFEAFSAIMADEAYMKYAGGGAHDFDAWVKMAAWAGHWQLNGFGMWVITEKDDDRLVGYAGLFCPEGWPEREVGWVLAPEMQGKGYATEAALAAREHAYNHLGWETAISLIAPLNDASQRVADRLGALMEREIELRGKIAQLWRHPSPAKLKELAV